MKKNKIIFTIMALLITQFACAQSILQSRLAFIKEGGRIDSLMDVILPKSNPNYRYFSLLLWPDGEYAVSQLDTNHEGILITPRFKDVQNRGYFEYKKYVVFVGGNTFKSELFIKDNRRKKFDIIVDEEDPAFSFGRALKQRFYNGYFYYYGGEFIENKMDAR